MGPLSSVYLEIRGEETLQHLQRLGVRVAPGNRLEAAVRLLSDLNGERLHLSPEAPDLLNRALEGFRTILDSFLIVHTLLARKKEHLFPPENLTHLVRGSESDGEGDPKPRSIQLEMVAAAKMLLGGADVRVEEPDISFLYHGTYVGGAIKRITKSRIETVEEALRAAVRQLKRYDKPGFAILSLDPFIEGIATNATAEDFGAEFNIRTEEAHQLLIERAGKDAEYLLGAIILGHGSRWDIDSDGGLRLEWVEATQFLRFSEDPGEVARASEFFGPLGERIWNNLEEAMALLIRPENQVEHRTGT